MENKLNIHWAKTWLKLGKFPASAVIAEKKSENFEFNWNLKFINRLEGGWFNSGQVNEDF